MSIRAVFLSKNAFFGHKRIYEDRVTKELRESVHYPDSLIPKNEFGQKKPERSPQKSVTEKRSIKRKADYPKIACMASSGKEAVIAFMHRFSVRQDTINQLLHRWDVFNQPLGLTNKLNTLIKVAINGRSL